ncbi:hypothetical protein EDD21DRAFT_391814 [Dissophora ornata]|nr:hypothetical protein EDD21DRAFT_391814 [Dissophora ornata]
MRAGVCFQCLWSGCSSSCSSFTSSGLPSFSIFRIAAGCMSHSFLPQRQVALAFGEVLALASGLTAWVWVCWTACLESEFSKARLVLGWRSHSALLAQLQSCWLLDVCVAMAKKKVWWREGWMCVRCLLEKVGLHQHPLYCVCLRQRTVSLPDQIIARSRLPAT